MKKQKKWFSLVELLVSISISTILMIWIWVLTTNSIKTIILQKNIIQNLEKINVFSQSLDNIFWWKYKYLWNFWSWFLFETNDILYWWNFYFLWIWDKIQNCESEWYFLKYWFFTPFEWKSLEKWSEENLFLSWKILNDYKDIVFWNWNDVFVNCYNNKICKFDKSSSSLVEIIWNEDFLKSNSFPINKQNISLNNSNWLTFWNQKLFVSDTFNNQILFLSWSEFYKIFDQFDWILKPEWIYFDENKNVLYISNSQKNEILSYKTDNLLSRSWSELKIFKNWLNYPTWLYLSWNLIVSNNFLSREKIIFDENWSIIKKENLWNFDTNFLQKDLKIKSLIFDNSTWINTIKLTFYTNFDCENPKNNKTNEIIYKK